MEGHHERSTLLPVSEAIQSSFGTVLGRAPWCYSRSNTAVLGNVLLGLILGVVLVQCQRQTLAQGFTHRARWAVSQLSPLRPSAWWLPRYPLPARSTCAYSRTQGGARTGPRTGFGLERRGQRFNQPALCDRAGLLSSTAARPEPVLTHRSSARFSGHFSSRP